MHFYQFPYKSHCSSGVFEILMVMGGFIYLLMVCLFYSFVGEGYYYHALLMVAGLLHYCLVLYEMEIKL